MADSYRPLQRSILSVAPYPSYSYANSYSNYWHSYSPTALYSPILAATPSHANLRNIRAHLLNGVSNLTLPAASMIVALGVSLVSGSAVAQVTVNPNQTTAYNLDSANNPITFGPTTNINTINSDNNAVTDTTGGIAWTIVNQGTIQGQVTGLNITQSGSNATITNTETLYGKRWGIYINESGTSITNSGYIGSVQGNGYGISAYGAGARITNQSGGTIQGAYGIKFNAASTVTNAGTIKGTSKDSLYFNTGNSSVSNSGTIQGGRDGISLRDATAHTAASTVTNSGAVIGTTYGVYIGDGGTVTNNASATITGNVSGIEVNNTKNPATTLAGTIVNNGTIIGTTKYGIHLDTGGSVTNNVGAEITGGTDGINISTVAATVINSGAITGTARYGINLVAGGYIANNAGATISGATRGINLTSGTVNNAGTITATGATGIGIYLTNTVSLNNTGTIQATGANGIGIKLATNVDFTNGGTISGGATGVSLVGGTLTNQTGKTIIGGTDGVSGSGTINNSGTITGTNGSGVSLAAGGYIANNAGATISGATLGINLTSGTVNNAGTITATGATGIGIYLTNTVSLNNTGTIQATGASGIGIKLATNVDFTSRGTVSGGGTGISLADGILTNQTGKTITGGTDGVSGSGTINNSGTITGTSGSGVNLVGGGDITNNAGATISGSIGVTLNGGSVINNGAITGVTDGVNGSGTINNSGTITGTTHSVAFTGNGTNVLTLNTGSVLSGDAVGSATATNNLILQGGGSGTISSNFSQFNNLNVASGAWIWNSSGTIAATTVDSTLTVGGTLTTAATVDAGGTLTVNNGGTVGGGSTGIDLVTGGNVTNNAGGTIKGTAVGLNSTGGTATNSGAIIGTGAGSTGVVLGVGSTAALANTGTISGDAIGLEIDSTTASVSNTGSVTATGAAGIGVKLAASVGFTNGGTISGGATGVSLAGGTFTNQTGKTITGGTDGVNGAGTINNSGTITGTTHSVAFTGNGTNVLTLNTNSVLGGDALGSATATNNLVLQGAGSANNNFSQFNNLNVQASSVWALNGTTDIGTATISSGTLAVNGTMNALTGGATVNSGGVLAGQGVVTGDVNVMNGGKIAPGAASPISNLTVNGNVNFSNGSTFQVHINSTGSDKLAVNGSATLAGAVNVLGPVSFTPQTQYTILSTTGSLTGTFDSNVSSSLPFLTLSLGYSPDNKSVFLNANVNNSIAFVDVAQTPNQTSVAKALAALPMDNPLVTAVMGQTVDSAHQAFNALSGEMVGTVQNTQTGAVQLVRTATLDRLRQAGYVNASGELGALGVGGPQLAYAADENASGKPTPDFPIQIAPSAKLTAQDLIFWTQAFGGWGHANGDGNAATTNGTFAGFTNGVDARFGDIMRVGFAAGYTRSDLHADTRDSSASVESVQIGGYASGRIAGFNVRGGATFSFDNIDTSRTVTFPGFFDQTHANFLGHVGQVFAELGYGMAFHHIAIEPLAGLSYVHVQNGAFTETGGAAALSSAGTKQDIGYSTLGLRAAAPIPLLNGEVMVPYISAQWQYAFGNIIPTATLGFQSTGITFATAGVPIARNTALLEGGLDWSFTTQAKLGISYRGELAEDAQVHTIKGTLTQDF